MKTPIIILHGWGLKGSVYSTLSDLLKAKSYKVFSPDMPGFGSEPLQKKSMNLDDYVSFLKEFMKKNKIKKTILIGHSFGGRVSLKFAWRNSDLVEKIILTGTPVIRHISLKKKIAYLFAVTFGKIFSRFPNLAKLLFRKLLYFAIGEWDYYKSGPLKQVFKNIIQEDLLRYIIEIKTPIFLVWGKDDAMTPASDVEKIKKYNKLIQSKIIPNIGHKLPYENPNAFVDAIMPFTKNT